MATTLAFSLSTPIRASSGSLQRPDPSRKKLVSSSSWWAPLFGLSSNPDYLNDGHIGVTSERNPEVSESDSDSCRSRSKATLRCFTEEKAKQLRKKTMENASFHDMMYHSAIAARLASDTSGWPVIDWGLIVAGLMVRIICRNEYLCGNPESCVVVFLLYSSEIWVMFSVCVSFEGRQLIMLCNIDLDRWIGDAFVSLAVMRPWVTSVVSSMVGPIVVVSSFWWRGKWYLFLRYTNLDISTSAFVQVCGSLRSLWFNKVMDYQVLRCISHGLKEFHNLSWS